MHPFPLDSMSRRLLRQAVLRVHPDVFAGGNSEAASFNAESLVVRKSLIDRRTGASILFFRSARILAPFFILYETFFCAKPSDKFQDNVVLDRSRWKKMQIALREPRCDAS